jgi:hypothetical protein
MANDFASNPINLDTFSSAIDVGNSMFGDSNARFKLNSIEWEKPTSTAHTAVVTDGGSKELFSEQCTTVNQSIIKFYYGAWVSGIKIGAAAVGSGKIKIAYH